MALMSCSRCKCSVPPLVERLGHVSSIACFSRSSIHLSQGREYPVVIFPLFMQHYILLSRNLLYTGLTRAKQLAILVGPTKAIGVAINRIMDRQRYTALADRLRHPGPNAQTTRT